MIFDTRLPFFYRFQMWGTNTRGGAILLWSQYTRPGKKEFLNLVSILTLHIGPKFLHFWPKIAEKWPLGENVAADQNGPKRILFNEPTTYPPDSIQVECDIPVPGILLLFGWYLYRYWTKFGHGKKVPLPENLGKGNAPLREAIT